VSSVAELPFKLPDPNFRVPDVVGTVEGWRVWRCTWNPRAFEVESPKLFSATHSAYYWTPKKWGEAECDRCAPPQLGRGEGPVPLNNIPGENCSCGFYSAKSLEHLMTMHYHQYDLDQAYGGKREVMILGRIQNWGKVIEATQGWRSQYAYPVKLWVPFEAAHLAKPLSETYGIPVALKNILGAGKGARNPFLAPNPPRF
jgi:hypothetical protein